MQRYVHTVVDIRMNGCVIAAPKTDEFLGQHETDAKTITYSIEDTSSRSRTIRASRRCDNEVLYSRKQWWTRQLFIYRSRDGRRARGCSHCMPVTLVVTAA